MNTKSIKRGSIFFALLFTLTFNFQLVAQDNYQETIVISTQMVQVNYYNPKDQNAPTRIFDGEKEITEFTILKPSENKLSLTILFDFEPCSSKKECRSVSNIGNHLKNALNNLRNNEKPNFIFNTEEMDLEDVQRMINFKVKSNEASSFEESLLKVKQTNLKTNQRQALLIITNKVKDIRDLNQNTVFNSYAGYVEIITTKTNTNKSWIGWNNLGLPGAVLQDNGNTGYIYDLQLREFVEICNLLHAVSFYRDDENSQTVSIKTYSKIYGEQTRTRVYLTPELNNKKKTEKYFDEAVKEIGQTINYKVEISDLLPIIKNNLITNTQLSEKVKKSQIWLKLKYGWTGDFPTVIFDLQKPYIGIQDFKVIAFSDNAVNTLTEAELAAVTAHEISHILLKNEIESEALEEKCDVIAFLILPVELRPSLFSAIEKIGQTGDRNHSGLRNHRLRENIAAIKVN